MRKKLRHVQGEKPGALSFPDQEAITVASLGAACTDRGGGDAAAVPVVEAQQKLMAYKLLVGRRALERRFPFAVRINGGYSPVCPQVEMKTFTVADEESADSDSDEEESGEQNVFNSMLDTFLGWLDYHLSGLENLLVAALAAALDDRKKAAVSIVDRVAQYILSMGDVDFEYPEPPKHEDASGAPSALDPEVMQMIIKQDVAGALEQALAFTFYSMVYQSEQAGKALEDMDVTLALNAMVEDLQVCKGPYAAAFAAVSLSLSLTRPALHASRQGPWSWWIESPPISPRVDFTALPLREWVEGMDDEEDKALFTFRDNFAENFGKWKVESMSAQMLKELVGIEWINCVSVAPPSPARR
jgi:hypothetical protein